MGLDFSYKFVIKRDKKEELMKFIKDNGTIYDDTSFSLRFDVDSSILKYLEGGYDSRPHYDKEEIKQHLTSDNKANIGLVYYKETIINNDELIFSLTAATSDMSLLFMDSMAIRRYFITLSDRLGSIITYLDMEYIGDRIIYFNRNEVFLEFKGEGFSRVENLNNIMSEFVKHWSLILSQYEKTYESKEKYSIVIKKDHITKLRNYIKRNGHSDKSQVALNFDLDSTILKYLEDGYGEQEYGIAQGVIPHFRKDIVLKHIETDNKVKIEKIDYLEIEISWEEEYLLVTFIPKKWNVDKLFTESVSIRDWFTELSREASVKMTFQNLWSDGWGHRIIYYCGEQINIEFTGHFDLDINTFSNINQVFSMYLKHFEDLKF